MVQRYTAQTPTLIFFVVSPLSTEESKEKYEKNTLLGFIASLSSSIAKPLLLTGELLLPVNAGHYA